ncbi:hypothetical protein RFI_02540, partial [Reticulomyxa filosa]
EEVDIFFDSKLCIPQRAKRLREAILDIHQLDLPTDLCLLIVNYEDYRKNLHMIHNVKLLPTLYPKLFPLRSFQLVRVASNVFTLSFFVYHLYCWKNDIQHQKLPYRIDQRSSKTIHKLVLIWGTFELFKNAYFNWIRSHFNKYNKAYFTKQKQMAAFKKQFLSQDCQVQLRLYQQRLWHFFWRYQCSHNDAYAMLRDVMPLVFSYVEFVEFPFPMQLAKRVFMKKVWMNREEQNGSSQSMFTRASLAELGLLPTAISNLSNLATVIIQPSSCSPQYVCVITSITQNSLLFWTPFIDTFVTSTKLSPTTTFTLLKWVYWISPLVVAYIPLIQCIFFVEAYRDYKRKITSGIPWLDGRIRLHQRYNAIRLAPWILSIGSSIMMFAYYVHAYRLFPIQSKNAIIITLSTAITPLLKLAQMTGFKQQWVKWASALMFITSVGLHLGCYSYFETGYYRYHISNDVDDSQGFLSQTSAKFIDFIIFTFFKIHFINFFHFLRQSLETEHIFSQNHCPLKNKNNSTQVRTKLVISNTIYYKQYFAICRVQQLCYQLFLNLTFKKESKTYNTYTNNTYPFLNCGQKFEQKKPLATEITEFRIKWKVSIKRYNIFQTPNYRHMLLFIKIFYLYREETKKSTSTIY